MGRMTNIVAGVTMTAASLGAFSGEVFAHDTGEHNCLSGDRTEQISDYGRLMLQGDHGHYDDDCDTSTTVDYPHQDHEGDSEDEHTTTTVDHESEDDHEEHTTTTTEKEDEKHTTTTEGSDDNDHETPTTICHTTTTQAENTTTTEAEVTTTTTEDTTTTEQVTTTTDAKVLPPEVTTTTTEAKGTLPQAGYNSLGALKFIGGITLLGVGLSRMARRSRSRTR